LCHVKTLLPIKDKAIYPSASHINMIREGVLGLNRYKAQRRFCLNIESLRLTGSKAGKKRKENSLQMLGGFFHK
jgi:hypothetical protein